MKKIYMIPCVCIVTVNTQEMIAASILEQTDSTTAEVDVTTTEEGYSGGFCSNRGYSVWDEEEDE